MLRVGTCSYFCEKMALNSMSSVIKEGRQQTKEQILQMIIALQQDILQQNRTESTEPSIDAENAPITSLLNAALNHSVTAENPNADTHATILLLINEAYTKLIRDEAHVAHA